MWLAILQVVLAVIAAIRLRSAWPFAILVSLFLWGALMSGLGAVGVGFVFFLDYAGAALLLWMCLLPADKKTDASEEKRE